MLGGQLGVFQLGTSEDLSGTIGPAAAFVDVLIQVRPDVDMIQVRPDVDTVEPR